MIIYKIVIYNILIAAFQTCLYSTLIMTYVYTIVSFSFFPKIARGTLSFLGGHRKE